VTVNAPRDIAWRGPIALGANSSASSVATALSGKSDQIRNPVFDIAPELFDVGTGVAVRCDGDPKPAESEVPPIKGNCHYQTIESSSTVVEMTTFEPAAVLSASESWDLLAGVSLGRVVTSAMGQPEIFPVNFVVQRRTVLFRTAEGTKLVSAAVNNHVLFEADDHDVGQGWSVVVKGTARMLRTHEELAEAERAQLLPWTATVKQHYVRVLPVSITGRRFRFGPEPECESTFA
jgi:nitroimidazol reductase NimA-like FMN-containing flavoprotein (pyridoxamine 5'-phosphate oxidase superfamily)